MKKLYVITKYVIARSIPEALRLQKKQSVDDAFLDQKWREGNIEAGNSKLVGFKKRK